MNRLLPALPFLLLPLTAGSVAAQTPTIPRAASEIVTSGDGEASLTPDRAVVRIGMQTNAPTAAAASSRNVRKVEAVIDTLRKLGYRVDSLRTVGFGVSPNYNYEEGRKLVDYQATATIRLVVNKLDRLGLTLDAVLAAGASDVSNIVFESDREEAGRRIALAEALRTARADAASLAEAAGGRLGRLLEATTQQQARPMMQMDMRASNAALPPQDVVVMVNVQARWEFLGGAAGQ